MFHNSDMARPESLLYIVAFQLSENRVSIASASAEYKAQLQTRISIVRIGTAPTAWTES